MVDHDQVDFILLVLDEAKAGRPFREIAREYGVDESRLRQWDKSFRGMTRAQIERVRRLEDEDSRLNRRVAQLDEENCTLNWALARTFDAAI